MQQNWPYRPCPPGSAPLGSACFGTHETAAQVRWRREVLMQFIEEQIERLEAHDRERRAARFPVESVVIEMPPIRRGRDASRAQRLAKGRSV